MSAPQTPPPSPSSRRAVREERERETADNKITITACTASIPSERRAEGLICVSPGSVERKPPLSLCYQLSGLVGECPAHTKDYGNDTQCLPARHLVFIPDRVIPESMKMVPIAEVPGIQSSGLDLGDLDQPLIFLSMAQLLLPQGMLGQMQRTIFSLFGM